MCTPLALGLITGTATVLSTATAITAAAQQANAQKEANQRAAEQAAAQATQKNYQANIAAQQEAAIETRERFNIRKAEQETLGSNIAEASASGLRGGYLQDVSQAIQLDAREQEAGLTVQRMFFESARRQGGAVTEMQRANMVDNLPSYDNTGLTITQGILGGLSTGLNVYSAGADSGFFDKKKPKTPAMSVSQASSQYASLGWDY
tara:strand:+ start:11555 stop:12172 length:618 start_codon:yes stop_codon:yes gene_type:complete